MVAAYSSPLRCDVRSLYNCTNHIKVQFVRSKEQDLLYTGPESTTISTTLSSHVNSVKTFCPLTPREPITSKLKPSRPFQEVAADFCSYAGQDYLILVDCHSDWPDIIPMGHNTTTPRVISIIKQSFCRTGVPDIFRSDQGPQLTAKMFQDFARTWGFQHIMSSPTYPQSNGKVEATVKSMKKLIWASWTGRYLDEDMFTRALLQYRNTPSRKDDLSPAMKLFGKPIQDSLPAHRRAFSEQWQHSTEEAEKQALTIKNKVEEYYNQHSHNLPDINVGSHVAIQNADTKCWEI